MYSLEPKSSFELGGRIPRSRTGIEGFDKIAGGLPSARTTLVVGGAGAGKTVFALQSLVAGARDYGEPGVFVSFEESSEDILANAAGFDWHMDELVPQRIAVISARLPLDSIRSGDFDLTLLLAVVAAKAEEIGAKRVVFDAIDGLLLWLDDHLSERREIGRVMEWARERHLTAIITSKAELGHKNRLDPHLDYLHFITDCVVILNRRLDESTSVRGLQISKFRGAAHSSSEFPIAIGPRGIFVAGTGAAEFDHRVFADRVSSGVSRLDAMLGGGYYRGSSILVSGEPGTAKSTLAASFAASACLGGERALLVSFDESADQIVRNMGSVGIDLSTPREAGLLTVIGVRRGTLSVEEHFMEIRRLIADHLPENLVIDPVSALSKAASLTSGIGAAERILDYAKSRGITVMFTDLMADGSSEGEGTLMKVSALADTWMQLSFRVRGGERNRAITIIKSRGMQHSNQVRELVLSAEGLSLADVYTSGGDVLMGTARIEKEQELVAAKEQHDEEFQLKLRQIVQAEQRFRLRIEEIKLELELKEVERAFLESGEKQRHGRLKEELDQITEARHADAP